MTSIIVSLIYLGFAGVWGSLLRNVRRIPGWTAGFGMFVFLPAALALPFTGPLLWSAWIAGLVITAAAILRPAFLPSILWQGRFASGYFAVVMILIFAWSLSTTPRANLLLLGFFALAAGVLCLRNVFSTSSGRR